MHMTEAEARDAVITASANYTHSKALIDELPAMTPAAVLEWAREQLESAERELDEATKAYTAFMSQPVTDTSLRPTLDNLLKARICWLNRDQTWWGTITEVQDVTDVHPWRMLVIADGGKPIWLFEHHRRQMSWDRDHWDLGALWPNHR